MSTDTAPLPVEAPAAPAPAPTGLFESIDWKNPVTGVMKIASHLQALNLMTPAERIILLQGGLLHVIGASKMSEDEKEAARIFVGTMLPHIVETAVVTLEATAKVHAAEKKIEEVTAAVMSKQPSIVVRDVEAMVAQATKGNWRCW